jgi:hypothetical protein
MGETVNFYGSLVCLAGCVSFIGVYSVMPLLTDRVPWWRYRIGRMLVTKAASIAGLMLIIVVTYAFHINLEWIRMIRGVFAAVVGVMMFYQTRLVYMLQKGYEGDNAE